MCRLKRAGEVVSDTEDVLAVEVPSADFVNEISELSGTIVFNSQEDSYVHRKIWVFGGGKPWLDVDFVLKENNLGPNSHLTLWSSWGDQHVYSRSQWDWQYVKKFKGATFLVMLTKETVDSDADPPSFKLRFNSTHHGSSYNLTREMITNNEVQVVSYPRDNTEDYPLKRQFFALIAPQNAFNLTLKYFDVPGSPGSCKTNFDVFLLKDVLAGPSFQQLPRHEHRQCGQVGNISEFLGSSDVALVQFHPKHDAKETGRGLSLEIIPLDDTRE